jgi:hypothetical protein
MAPTLNRRLLFFVSAILLAVATTVFIGFSVGTIRDSVHFSRLMRRIEFGENDPQTLLEAAEYARRPADWERLLHVAWGPHLRGTLVKRTGYRPAGSRTLSPGRALGLRCGVWHGAPRQS